MISLKRYTLFIILLSVSILSTAQKRLKAPLAFVPADSVVLWGESYNDLRGMALRVDKTLQAKMLKPVGQEYKKALKTWRKELLPAATLTGACEKGRGESMLQNAILVEQAGGLFLETADSRFIDVAERVLWGDLMREVISPAPVSFEKHTASRSLVDATAMIYATSGEDLWVNLFTNSTTHVKTDEINVIVDQMTGMPIEGRVKIRLTGYSRGRFHVRLHVRIPGWAVGRLEPKEKYAFSGNAEVVDKASGANASRAKLPTFYINGRESLTSVVENGYFVIDGTWNSGDEVMVEFPMEPYFVEEKVTDKQAVPEYRLFRGVLEYVPQRPSKDVRLSPNVTLKETENEDGIPLYEVKDAKENVVTFAPYISVW